MQINYEVNKMLERITDGFYALNEDWHITYANSRAEEILNLKKEDYLHKSLWTSFPELIGTEFAEQFQKAAKEKSPLQFNYHFPLFNSWYEIHVYPSPTGLSVFFTDISSRIKAEKERQELDRKMQQQQQQLISVLERVKDGFVSMNNNWEIIYFNQEAELLMQKKRSEVIGKNIWETFPMIIGGKFKSECFRAQQEQVIIQFINYVQAFDTWFDNRIYPSETGVSVFFQDISERKKAERERKEYEQKLKKQNEQLVNILERINQGFYSLDKDFKVTYWNKKAEELYGVPRTEVLGQYIRTLYNEASQNFYRPMLQQVLQEQTPIHSEHICPQYGKWYEVNMYPSEDGISIFFKDIDQRKRTEEELHKLSLIARQTDNLVIITDADGKITWVNDAFNKVTGYTLEEVLGNKPGNILRGPESNPEMTQLVDEKTKNGEPFTVETVNYTKSKEKFWVEIFGQPVLDKNGKIAQYFAIQTNITKRKKLELELQEQQKKIHAAVIAAQEKERAQVGQELHDNVNQVPTTVKLYSELCRDGIGDSNEILNKSIKLLQDSINEIRSLSKRLSAPSLGNIKLKESVKELIDAVTATGKVAVLLDTVGIGALEVKQEVHLCIYRILQEHLTNVLKHAAAREVQVILRVLNGNLQLLVSDDGKGFDPKIKSTGIGITNMHTRAESLKGALSITSAPGDGCQLQVKIPLEEPTAGHL